LLLKRAADTVQSQNFERIFGACHNQYVNITTKMHNLEIHLSKKSKPNRDE